LFSRRFTRATSACSARKFVIVEIPDTFVGVRLFVVSNLPLAVQLPSFNLIFIRQGRRNEMTLSRVEGKTESVWLNNHPAMVTFQLGDLGFWHLGCDCFAF
jgi:hypothetical protein